MAELVELRNCKWQRRKALRSKPCYQIDIMATRRVCPEFPKGRQKNRGRTWLLAWDAVRRMKENARRRSISVLPRRCFSLCLCFKAKDKTVSLNFVSPLLIHSGDFVSSFFSVCAKKWFLKNSKNKVCKWKRRDSQKFCDILTVSGFLARDSWTRVMPSPSGRYEELRINHTAHQLHQPTTSRHHTRTKFAQISLLHLPVYLFNNN